MANLITIVPHVPNVAGGSGPKNLTDADVSALQKAPDVATITPATTGTATVETSTIKFLSANITGITEIWAQINSRDLSAGSFFDQAQVRSATKMVVLGPTVATTLFGEPAAALRQTVQIDHQPFQVIGVLPSYGQQLDDTAVMPLTTARRYIVGHNLGVGTELSQIIVQAPQQAVVPAAMTEVTRILTARHHITDFRLRDFQVTERT